MECLADVAVGPVRFQNAGRPDEHATVRLVVNEHPTFPLDASLLADALDVLQNVVQWRLTATRWATVCSALDAMRAAYDAGDVDAVRKACSTWSWPARYGRTRSPARRSASRPRPCTTSRTDCSTTCPVTGRRRRTTGRSPCPPLRNLTTDLIPVLSEPTTARGSCLCAEVEPGRELV
jgi:CATRA-associated small protein